MSEIKVYHDDQVDESAYKAISVVNELLKEHNLFVNIDDDGQFHDGFNVLNISLNTKKIYNNEDNF